LILSAQLIGCKVVKASHSEGRHSGADFLLWRRNNTAKNSPPRAAVPHEHRVCRFSVPPCLRGEDFSSQFGQHDSRLLLVFAGFVFVAGFARLVALEEQDLAESFIGIDLGGERRAVGNL
jgi:hypothetical protein